MSNTINFGWLLVLWISARVFVQMWKEAKLAQIKAERELRASVRS